MRKMILLLMLTFGFGFCYAQQKQLDSLLNELKRHPQEDTTRIKLLSATSNIYSLINPDKGLETANEELHIAKKIQGNKWLAFAYNDIAQSFITKGSVDTALQLFKSALQIYNLDGNIKGMAKIYGNMGAVSYYKSDFYSAIDYQQKALDIFNKVPTSKTLIASCTSNIGLYYLGLSKLPKALTYYQKALQIYENEKDSLDIANTLGIMTDLYRQMQEFSKGIEAGKEAIAISQSADYPYGLSLAYGNVGQVYYFMHQTDQAITYYLKALKIADEHQYVDFQSVISQMLGSAYSTKKDYQKALIYTNQSIDVLTKTGDKINLSQCYDELGKIYLKCSSSLLNENGIKTKDRFTKALVYQNKALQLAQEANALEKQEIIWGNLSATYEKQNDYKKALESFKKSAAYKDSVLNDSSKQALTRLEMQYQFNKTQDSIKAITDKQQTLVKAEIQKQHIIQNAVIAGSGFLLLAAIGGFLFYKRNRDIKLQKNEAVLKQQVTDTEMKALRAQMNPHFIFNSLNSIADYIDNNQTKIASDFTAKFAKLMRMVLENSEHKEIPLANDLKALELYMQLESFRLQNKFDYHIEIEENIDPENTLVPPLILQPFVENSIWHGLAKKEGKGHLTIRIRQAGNMLNYIVEDDGRGMNEAGIAEERKSLGMKITGARIDIINQLKNAGASMKVANRKEGVRAEVMLPLELSF